MSSTSKGINLIEVSTSKLIKKFDSNQGLIEIGRGSKLNKECQNLSSGLMRTPATKVMSQRHAILNFEVGGGKNDELYPFLTDIGSTNGTTVERNQGEIFNLKPNIAYRLKQNDVITFGKQTSGKDKNDKHTPISLRVHIFSVVVAAPVVQTNRIRYNSLPFGEDEDEEFQVNKKSTLSTEIPKQIKNKDKKNRSGYGLSDEDLLEFNSSSDIEITMQQVPESFTTITKTKNEAPVIFISSDDEYEDDVLGFMYDEEATQLSERIQVEEIDDEHIYLSQEAEDEDRGFDYLEEENFRTTFANNTSPIKLNVSEPPPTSSPMSSPLPSQELEAEKLGLEYEEEKSFKTAFANKVSPVKFNIAQSPPTSPPISSPLPSQESEGEKEQADFRISEKSIEEVINKNQNLFNKVMAGYYEDSDVEEERDEEIEVEEEVVEVSPEPILISVRSTPSTAAEAEEEEEEEEAEEEEEEEDDEEEEGDDDYIDDVVEKVGDEQNQAYNNRFGPVLDFTSSSLFYSNSDEEEDDDEYMKDNVSVHVIEAEDDEDEVDFEIDYDEEEEEEEDQEIMEEFEVEGFRRTRSISPELDAVFHSDSVAVDDDDTSEVEATKYSRFYRPTTSVKLHFDSPTSNTSRLPSPVSPSQDLVEIPEELETKQVEDNKVEEPLINAISFTKSIQRMITEAKEKKEREVEPIQVLPHHLPSPSPELEVPTDLVAEGEEAEEEDDTIIEKKKEKARKDESNFNFDTYFERSTNLVPLDEVEAAEELDGKCELDGALLDEDQFSDVDDEGPEFDGLDEVEEPNLAILHPSGFNRSPFYLSNSATFGDENSADRSDRLKEIDRLNKPLMVVTRGVKSLKEGESAKIPEVTVQGIDLPAPITSTIQTPLESPISSLKRQRSVMEIDSIPPPTSTFALEETSTTNPVLEPELPVIKRRRMNINLKHVSLSSTIGFVSGVVATFVGLNALEGYMDGLGN